MFAIVLVIVAADRQKDDQLFIDNQYRLKVYSAFEKAEMHMRNIKAMLKEDSIRVEAVQKVEKIIGQYNAEMPIELKKKIANEIYNASVKYDNLDVDFICATITHESARTWDPEVMSHAGAIGLMQVMPRTGQIVSGVLHDVEWKGHETLYDPIANIRIGTEYLNDLIGVLGDKEVGLAAYNGGPARAERWLRHDKNNRYLARETRKYIPYVMRYYTEYSGGEQYNIYTVQRNDYLAKIAKKFGVSPEQILTLNEHLKADTMLHPGMVLKVPTIVASNDRG